MRAIAHATRLWLLISILFVLTSDITAAATNDLHWRKNGGADAFIERWPLQQILARLSALSGWKIYTDPDLDPTLTIKFKNLPHSEALKFLLGGANYALVPDTKNGAKLYVYKTTIAEATALVVPDRSSKPKNWIPNEIILTFAPGSTNDVSRIAAELGGKIVGTAEELNAYRLEFPDADSAQTAREKLAARQGFEMQDNYSFDRPPNSGTASPNQSLASIFPIDPKPVTVGEHVTVALVDTPVQTLDGKMKDFVLPSIHVSEPPQTLPAEPTHGTSMTETLLNSLIFTKGATKDSSALGTVRIQPIDIYGSSSTTTTFEVAQGLYKAIQSGAQVINLSLGGTGDSPMVDYLLENARKKQILVFASAGNTPTTDPTWPAANPNTIAVTAADAYGNIASYANHGSFVDVKAPGSSRISYNGQTYISSGTSTATAFVSGQAAGLAAQGFTTAQTSELILKNFDVNGKPNAPPSARR